MVARPEVDQVHVVPCQVGPHRLSPARHAAPLPGAVAGLGRAGLVVLREGELAESEDVVRVVHLVVQGLGHGHGRVDDPGPVTGGRGRVGQVEVQVVGARGEGRGGDPQAAAGGWGRAAIVRSPRRGILGVVHVH